MAVITFEFMKDNKMVRRTQGATRSQTRLGWDIGVGGFVPDRYVVETKLTNTKHRHCFYCWNDAEKYDGEVEVCDDHAPAGAPELLNKWEPGMHDEKLPEGSYR